MRKRWIIVMGLAALVGLALGAENSASQDREKADCWVQDGKTVYLDQGREWGKVRCQFYHYSQNARLINYRWFMSLEDPWQPGRFVDNLAQYGLLPDGENESNPDGLPVGLAKTDNPYIRPPQVGFTCAFCHTGQVIFNGKHYRVDGAPSMQQNFKFLRALGTALRLTLEDKERFMRFAEKVSAIPGLRIPPPKKDSKEIASLALDLRNELIRFAKQARIDPVEWGPGRFDALGRGGNMIFHESQWGPEGEFVPGPDGQPALGSDNVRPPNGPVSLPHLWGAWGKDWFLWNGSIQNPVARAMVEALSIDTKLQLSGEIDDPWPVDVQRLLFLDEQGQKLQPPRWPPAPQFPPIDIALARQGQELFGNSEKKGLCAGCHFPTAPVGGGQRWHVHMSPLRVVGTDRISAGNWYNRRLALNSDLADLAELPPEGYLSEATQKATSIVMQRHRDAMLRAGKNIKNNDWRRCVLTAPNVCEPAYVARPLDGIWATAPYLHNGSIPNLDLLLSPQDVRDQQARTFCVGPEIEFDPVNVGLTVRQCPEVQLLPHSVDFHFDTSKPGNWNKGHEFVGEKGKPLIRAGNTFNCDDPKYRPAGVLGCSISSEERKALLEYLKIIQTPGFHPHADRANERPAMAP
jgi:processive rubber oxygenase RoxA-like protein